jgi:cell division control protein 6
LEQIEDCLAPARVGRKPTHTWLHGDPGSGKTAAAKSFLTRLRQQTGISFVAVNCWERGTLYGILDQAITELKIFRAEEHRASVKLERLKRHLGSRCLVFLLDEIDRISPRDRSAILYSLDAIGNTGLICVSNAIYPLYDLEERVRSRINPRIISFARYSRAELAAVLTDRAHAALAPEACPTTIVNRIASLSSGDARVAIQTLRNAAEAAERVGHEAIALSDVAAGWHDSQRVKAAQMLVNLTEDHRMLHKLTAPKTDVLSTELWEAYLQLCSQGNRRPIAPRTFSEYLNQLVRLGLLTCERARVKGNVRLLKSSE